MTATFATIGFQVFNNDRYIDTYKIIVFTIIFILQLLTVPLKQMCIDNLLVLNNTEQTKLLSFRF